MSTGGPAGLARKGRKKESLAARGFVRFGISDRISCIYDFRSIIEGRKKRPQSGPKATCFRLVFDPVLKESDGEATLDRRRVAGVGFGRWGGEVDRSGRNRQATLMWRAREGGHGGRGRDNRMRRIRLHRRRRGGCLAGEVVGHATASTPSGSGVGIVWYMFGLRKWKSFEAFAAMLDGT